MVENKKLSYLDLIKVIASLCVVFNHCFRENISFMDRYGAEFVGRWTIGCFCIISGLFVGDKFVEVVKYCYRILIMYLIWTVFYALYTHANIWSVRDFIFTLRNGVIMPFWYFPSLMMCIVFVWVLKVIFKNPYIVLGVTCVLFIIAYMGDTLLNVQPVADIMDRYFFPIFERIFGIHDTRDGIFNLSLYLAIGNVLKSRLKSGGLKLDDKQKKVCCVLLAVVAVIYIIEHSVITMYNLGNHDVSITAPLISTVIVILGLQYTMDGSKAIFLRKISSLVYTTHYMFLTNMQKITTNQWLWFVTTAALSILTAVIIIELSKKIKPIKYLY